MTDNTEKRLNMIKNSERYTVMHTEKELYGEKFTTYGIKGNTCCFDDISTDICRVLAIADILNTEDVEECHFYDVISDEIDK